MSAIELGQARLTFLPQVGGAVASFTVGGRDVLRAAASDTVDALAAASFPLVPFCNRIPHGRFVFDGREVVLPPNLPGHPHALHGQGWRAAWAVERAEDGEALLSYEHPSDVWPWAYRAEQRFVLKERGFRAELTVINTGEAAMPAGLGFHPYFPRRPGETLTAANDGVWLIDTDVLPTVHHPGPWEADWTAGALVEGHGLIDHCYTGWDQRAVLRAPGQPDTVITASPECRWLHVYVPPGADFLCVEPCASRPNPFGDGDTGMVVLQPGERRSIWMEIATA
ncbi:aldose 1-epimerase [Caulobacter sp. BP25]|uniref:aldose 1-epimerase n=1 Tax=Caulobacter sp. BP25 TaxID=2048900 RepID=UPI000C12AAF3|nr:aldose 1-epimerase [Caulobacter sp. BP25]PHY18213.1 aldose epimerase [Caulobacter sp. BP25]